MWTFTVESISISFLSIIFSLCEIYPQGIILRGFMNLYCIAPLN